MREELLIDWSSYMEILKEMPERIPMDGTFELTVRCNLKCKMCLFRHDDSENEEIIKNERTAEEWIDMARQVAEAGTFNLLITGGEPMLRKDFCEIYEGIYKQGFMLTLYTNATLVTPKIMKTLRRYPPHRIGVTIYGASEETYEKVCGNGKAFNRAMEGVKLLSTLPSILEFRTTIIKDNYHEVDEIEELVHKGFGEDKTLTQTRTVLKAVRGASSDVESCRLQPRDNVRLFLRRELKVVENIIGKNKFDIKNVKFEFNKIKTECTEEKISKPYLSLFGCTAGMKAYTITWNGELLGCQVLDKFYEEPFKDGFNTAWTNYPISVKVPKLNEKCNTCINSDMCTTCYAARYIETGSLGGCPGYICNEVDELLKLKNS